MEPSSSRPVNIRSGAQTRDQLIRAATSLFARSGYHGTSTAHIAAAAGVSEPTLFKHFGTKQALLVAALKEAAGGLVAELEAAPDLGDEPEVDPFEVFSRRARGLLLDPRLAELSRLRNYALATSDEVDMGALTTGLETFLEKVAGAVTAGQRFGSVRNDVAPANVADIVLAVTLLYGTRSAIYGNETAAAQVSPIVDTLLDLLRTTPRPQD